MSEVESIRLPNRFDYSFHKQFGDIYAPMLDSSSTTKEVILEFGLVEYLDSSALGMMVLMQKKMFSKNIKVKIKGARGATDEILKMANMNKLFEFI